MSLFGKARGGVLPRMDGMERYGAEGEEAVLRRLSGEGFTLVQSPLVPKGELFLEKDILVVADGVPFVVEVKNWKGKVRIEGRDALQEKADGTKKTHKNPVGTTVQFLREMKNYYGVERDAFGIVVFADPDCTFETPTELDGVALLSAKDLVPYIKKVAKRERGAGAPFDPSRILRCTRLYGEGGREFCKGLLVDRKIPCVARDGAKVLLDTTKLAYITVERRPFFAGYRLYVTFSNNATAIFRAKRQKLVVGCLDGSFCTFSLGAVRHIAF